MYLLYRLSYTSILILRIGGRDGTRTRNLGVNSAVVPPAFAVLCISFPVSYSGERRKININSGLPYPRIRSLRGA